MKQLLLVVLLAVVSIGAVEGKKRIMPWMCLERCHEDIPKDLVQIEQLAATLTAVSFESHDLDLDGVLKDNKFTKVYPRLRAAGLEGHAMITTANITKLRQLWGLKDKFIQQVVAAATNESWTGVNIDFEPERGDPPTAADAKQFADFLDKLAAALHPHGIVLSVDIASWSAFWDNALLAATRVDKILTMDTYCGDFALFETRVAKAVKQFGVDRLGIGMETVNPTTGKPFSLEELQKRFAVLKQHNVKELDIWMTPIPDLWIPLLKDWIQ
jgi:hypothetical protein